MAGGPLRLLLVCLVIPLVWAGSTRQPPERKFAVHWNIIGDGVSSLISPAVNACISYNDTITLGEDFGKFFPGHAGSGFASTCSQYPCGLAAAFAGNTGGFLGWEKNFEEWLAEHRAKIHADVATAGTSDWDGLTIFDYENWFLQWETKWQESFNGPFIASWMDFISATNFPNWDKRMMAQVGWTIPPNTTGWGDVTIAERDSGLAATYDHFIAVYVNTTLAEVNSAMPRAKWGFFAYPWFRHPKQVDASRQLNDQLGWLWSQLDVFAPAFYPEFYTTSDPGSAPCNHTNTPAEDAALYTPNILEAVRLRERWNPDALVLPYIGWYNPCNTMCSMDNIHDMIALPAELGADGVILFGSDGKGTPFPTPQDLADSITHQWGPEIIAHSTKCAAP